MDPILIVAFVMLAGLMYFNGRKRKQQAAQLAEQVVIGAKVLLSSGVVATIVRLNEKTAVVETAGSKLEVLRSVIVRVDSDVEVAEKTVVEAAPVAKAAAKPATKPAVKSATAAAAKSAAKAAPKTATKPAAKKPAAKSAAK